MVGRPLRVLRTLANTPHRLSSNTSDLINWIQLIGWVIPTAHKYKNTLTNPALRIVETHLCVSKFSREYNTWRLHKSLLYFFTFFHNIFIDEQRV